MVHENILQTTLIMQGIAFLSWRMSTVCTWTFLRKLCVEQRAVEERTPPRLYEGALKNIFCDMSAPNFTLPLNSRADRGFYGGSQQDSYDDSHRCSVAVKMRICRLLSHWTRRVSSVEKLIHDLPEMQTLGTVRGDEISSPGAPGNISCRDSRRSEGFHHRGMGPQVSSSRDMPKP